MRTRAPLDSMFVRRLIGLSAIVLVVFGLLGAQLARLAVAEHDDHLQTAERRLDRSRFLPTYRGRILDRNGRVLAVDRPSYDLAIEYEFRSGAWTARRAAKAAKAQAIAERGPSAWARLGPAGRDAAIAAQLPSAEAAEDALLGELSRLTQVPRSELDARIEEITQRIHTRAVAVWDRQRELERSRHADEGEGADERFTPRPIQEHRESHVVVEALPDVVAYELQRLADEWPGTIEVQESTRRENPLETLEVDVDRSHLPRNLRSTKPLRVTVHGVADHIVGELREKVWPSDLARRPFLDPGSGAVVDLGGYRPSMDRVGSRGAEASQEGILRGSRGMIRKRLDTGETIRTEPIPGRDVTLTIDIELQATVQALMDPAVGLMRTHAWQAPTNDDSPDSARGSGDRLYGAAVVLDVDSGEILAAVSTPTIADGSQLPAAEQERLSPYVNRPFEAPYPPGSILKPLIYLGAVESGAVGRDVRVECNGHFLPEDTSRLRCWIYREKTGFVTHSATTGGPLDVTGAIARSCNIFFYTMATRLGGERLVAWLRRVGVGAPLDTGLLLHTTDRDGRPVVLGEQGGFLPDHPKKLAFSEVAQMGIGQGPLAWTPVHAANAYATLARGGVVRDATVVRVPAGGPDRAERPVRADLPFDSRAVTMALRGLHDVVAADFGTGNHIKYDDGTIEPIVDLKGEAEGIVVWAKTGTVQTQAPPDHAWFVGLVGPASEGRPKLAIAVIVEHGRSGGRTAGPLFNQIVYALRRLGYLPPLAPSKPDGRGRAEREPARDTSEDGDFDGAGADPGDHP
ncbi:MAG: penicillin-binding transpeptidase domain-containing protein [Phycisphaerales bacterium]